MSQLFIHYLDVSGAIFALISTVLYIKPSHHAWPIGILAISINIILFLSTGLYADASKEGIFWILSFYGWYWWLHGSKSPKQLSISHLKIQHAFILCLLCILGTLILVIILTHYTNSKVPYWDAITTVLSLLAQWLTCRKIIESWIAWFGVDLLYTGLYFYKGLPAHGTLLVLYMVLAIFGYLSWNRQIPSNQNSQEASQLSPIPRL